MKVIKRSGDTEDVSFDKVLNRMKKLCEGFGKNPLNVDIYDISQKVCARIYNNVSTSDLDELAAHICSSMIIENPDYGEMAARIIVSNHHKNTSPSFSETIMLLFGNKDVDGRDNPLISELVYDVVMKNKEKLNSYIDYSRDYEFDFFGFKTLEKAYLMRVNGVIVERPQHMFMRVALGIHGEDMKEVLQTYDLMSKKYFVHATPTLFNSGTPRPQLSSCFLLSSTDSIEGIYNTLKECAQISKYAGGIGMHIHGIRAKGSRIRGTNGNSTGIIPMLRVFNNTARYVNQCFTPDTLVYSSKGMKRMDSVSVGDLLVTADGSFKPVLKVAINTSTGQEILAIQTSAVSGELKCTLVHEIAVVIGNDLVYKPASDLQVGDLLFYPENIGKDMLDVIPCPGGYAAEITNISRIAYNGNLYDFNMMDNHNYLTSHGIVHNSGKRNGSIAVYLEPWHADTEHFLELRKPHGSEEERTRDLFLALWVPDLFMERVKENGVWSLMCPDKCPGLSDVYGDEFKELYEKYESEQRFIKQIPAQKIWFKILESQIESGQPYLCFKDAANKKSNQKNLGTIKSSNLCVASETMVLTDNGYFPIKDLHDQAVNVWNGNTFSSTVVKQTGRMQKLITIKFNNGMVLRCTPYHKFYIETSTKEEIVEAKDLKLGMNIIRYNLPTINNSDKELKYAYTQGVYSADGTHCFCKNEPMLWLYGDRRIMVNHLNWLYMSYDDSEDRIHISLPNDIKDKYFVPLNYSLNSKLKWLEGYIDSDGRIVGNSIQLSNLNKSFLDNVFFMLQTLGVNPSISTQDGTFYNITIDAKSITHLVHLGFSPKRLYLSSVRESRNINPEKYVCVSGIEDKGEYDDTYCFNEPLEHKGIFNGILTGQCSEIIEYSDQDETSVCNLASIALPSYVEDMDDGQKKFNFKKLHEITKVITKNLNKVIDVNFYPVEKARRSNLRHRPIGVGVQGLADTFAIMKYPFDSDAAANLNKQIFETIYHGALEASMEISKKRAEIGKNSLMNLPSWNEFESCDDDYPGAYSTFKGSPASEGKLQFDLWNVEPTSGMYDWNALKENIKKWGLRNSLLLAPMPTASTSQILGFNECFEPFTSNLYKRKTLAGEFIMVNKYLIKELINLGVWTKDLKDKIIIADGSIQTIDNIPQDLKDLFKTVWEIKQKSIIDMAADRGAFICQSQSLNLFMEDPDFKKLSSMHFYSWGRGLKTGIYYLRSKAKAQAQKFTIDPSLQKMTTIQQQASTLPPTNKANLCNSEDGVCLLCSS